MIARLVLVGGVFVAGFALGSGHWALALLALACAVYALGEDAHQAAERGGRH